MTRYFLVGGKGGVGKTSIASAMALAFSKKNKTLLVSTDPVFALSDLWGTKLTNKPKKIKKNLFAKHINPDFFAGSTTSSPCASEKAALSELASHLFSEKYDKIVFDTAPTGHTLQLLKAPQEWKEFIEKTPLACGSEDGDKEVYEKMTDILKTDQTLFNFVLIPEKLSIEETKRATNELGKIGMKRFGFIVNQIIPPEAVENNLFLKNRYDMQKQHLKEIRDLFGCCSKLIYLQNSEVKGEERLETISNQLFTNCCG